MQKATKPWSEGDFRIEYDVGIKRYDVYEYSDDYSILYEEWGFWRFKKSFRLLWSARRYVKRYLIKSNLSDKPEFWRA